MPFDGNGNYTPSTPAYPAITGTTIQAADWNTVVEDIAAALSNVLTRDGQSPPTADLPMGAHKITNLAAAVLASDAMRFDQRYAAAGGQIIANAYTKPVAVAAAANMTFTTTSSNIFTTTLNQNVTIAFNPANPDGQTVSIRFVQDATGNRTVTLPANAVAAGTIDPTANHVSWLTLTYTSVAGRWEGSWMSV